MAKSNREFVSLINNSLNAISDDVWVSPKYILDLGKDVLADFLKKESESRRITNASEGWSELDCLKMIQVPINECAELDTHLCTTLMRTKDKLPETFTGYYGNIIKTVASLNFGQFYDPVRSPRVWRDIQNREFQDKTIKYYFFINGYIYIPNSDVESIRVEAYFQNKWEVDAYNKKNCESCKQGCIKPLDYEFVAPEYLLSAVQTEVINKILVRFKIPPDNLIDNNSFQKTEQKQQ